LRAIGLIVAVLWFGQLGAAAPALANHLCLKDQAGNLSDSAVIGLIRKKYEALGGLQGALGCVLSQERDVPGGGGRYTDFANGQIVFSQAQKMTVAAWTADDGVHVDWTVEDTYSHLYT